jgi:UDP-glucuronate decarboxylase
MKILVTGGAGFIGANLCRRLISEGHDVSVLDDFSTGTSSGLSGLQVEILQGSVVDPFDIPCERIFHLACPASPSAYQADGVGTLLTAFVGTLRALENAQRYQARVLVASTSEVYGDPEVSPQPETYCGKVPSWGPRACYDEGKRAAESLCYEFKNAGRADVRVARIFNTYGPGMRLDDGRVVSEFIRRALRGEPLELHAGGQQTRSFCYVDDMVEGLIRLMDKVGVDGPVNLGRDAEVTVAELAATIGRVLGRDLPVVSLPARPDDPMRRRPDLSKARAELGWVAETPLDEGVVRTLRAFKHG